MLRRMSIKARAVTLALALVLGSQAAGPASADVPPPTGYADIVARLLPSVVSIYIRSAVPKDNEASGKGPIQYARQESQGSGFIIDPSGYIITNRHVIEGAYDITVCVAGSAHAEGPLGRQTEARGPRTSEGQHNGKASGGHVRRQRPSAAR